MEKSNKRGKIPQSDWPSIMARYEAGETLASIARTYDCSPPAISYVVSRSRERQRGNGMRSIAPAPRGGEPQLIKVPAAEPVSGIVKPPPHQAPAVATPPVVSMLPNSELGRRDEQSVRPQAE